MGTTCKRKTSSESIEAFRSCFSGLPVENEHFERFWIDINEELTAHLVQCFSGFFLRVTVQGHGTDLLTDDLKVEVEHLVPSALIDKYPSCFLPKLFRVFVARDSTSATSCHFDCWATVSQWQCMLLDAALDLLPECGQSSILSGP